MQSYTEIFDKRGDDYNRAGQLCPDARRAEVDAVLDLIAPNADSVIVDAPAGGGIVGERIEQRGLAHRQIICVEPSKQFAAAIKPHFTVLHDEVGALSMADNSADIITSLAGVHHIEDRLAVYKEWYRVLKPGGQMVIADVSKGTPTARFLNGFVDRFNPLGHQGIFIAHNEFDLLLQQAGFEVTHNRLTDVYWSFDSQTKLGEFCKSLFALTNASAEQTAQALAEDVGISVENGQVLLHWQLQYASAVKSIG